MMTPSGGFCRFALHGGAGIIDPENFSAARRAAYSAELERIAQHAWRMLVQGADALDVVEAAVALLEDCEYFNAGRGAVLNRDGEPQFDASLMDGATRRAGAVAAVRTPRNPIRLARAVMEHSEHVMLVGPDADRYAAEHGVVQATRDYFVIPEREAQLALARAHGRVSLDHDENYGNAVHRAARDKSGTVGAVARDLAGHLAAATSTGGMTNKLPGRVGDTPIIGAGTWADDATCAVSTTGHGEFFMRGAVAHDVHARIRYGGNTIAVAAKAALDDIQALGGSGGLIAIGADGTIAMPFNSPGMYRAWVDASGKVRAAIYPGD